MNTNVKTWYISEFSDDKEMGETLNENVTFQDVYNCLLKHDEDNDIYDCLGGNSDTIVRERVFEKLADTLQKDYEFIYNLWLNIN